MGWVARLTDDRGHSEGWWDFTHNTSGMANHALDITGFERPADTQECWALPMVDGRLTHYPDGIGQLTWWKCLDGLDGPHGAALLDRIIRQMEAEPEFYRAMNPENGWGNYDDFLKVLAEMRNAVPEWPTVWSASG